MTLPATTIQSLPWVESPRRSGDHRLATTFSIHNPSRATRNVPLSFGVPFAHGLLTDPRQIDLCDAEGNQVPHQSQILARWSDQSIRWLLVDAVARTLPSGTATWLLSVSDSMSPEAIASQAADARSTTPTHDLAAFVPGLHLDFVLTTKNGRTIRPRLEAPVCDVAGPIRSTLSLDGTFPRTGGLRFHGRVTRYEQLRLVRLDLRLHNPRRAQHPGGLWDLGDAGSILFQAFEVALRRTVHGAAASSDGASAFPATWTIHPSAAWHDATAGHVEIDQYSSGGPAIGSPNHVDREGRVPLRGSGFRVRSTGSEETTGLRASPLVSVASAAGRLTTAIPEFWQQFPKSLAAHDGRLTAGLFPDHGHAYELQGGEQKTHTVWITLDDDPASLAWVHAPPRITFPPELHTGAEPPPYAVRLDTARDGQLIEFLRAALSGSHALSTRRDRIDEYGWRNYGDIPADHEQEHYAGSEAVVSHYNNQFDMVFGGILQLCRTEDPRWFDLFDPLARHVIDIDLYHTQADRAAYNGGLFWHTDHYRTAGTSTHRAYSKANRAAGTDYGGGPGCEHNYTSGLLHYHFLTGNPDARDAVLALADWVIAMDDGRRSLFGALDDGPTGLATATAEPDYHGPGRGAGNSLNALTDAWILARDPRYAGAAEALIRRVVHPTEDIAALRLLNAEMRWSYTVFLVALSKWLDEKAAGGELDAAYAYAQHSLLHYARWMAANERPYFDRREELEFPTSTWPAQDLRKANVLRLAARHADEPERSHFLARGDELARRAWSDLEQFGRPDPQNPNWTDTRYVARVLSLLMTEGAREAWLRTDPPPAPRVPEQPWPSREAFVPQKARVRTLLRSPGTAARAGLRLLNPLRWPGLLDELRKHL